ncbi:uncharacterized protein LOC125424101 isoform X2 [Ziziphus jujuba]|uniref:Uncharacterized protein LOC125424101 isoform X2 n=1 Tax=Ziziphus jujuba TaxID=326968 RepID=A0ABM4AHI2_ZIZJJ|nr:uncharacterized protein LOC125424101 isoform X2 [Ziziphus jujuba]
MENQFSYPLQSRTSNTIETDPVRTHLITATPFPSTILKLDASNFLIWKLQFLPILRGHKLDKFVLKDKPPFMQEIGALECEIDEEILNRYSSEQQLWILQDQLLQGWIVAAISPSVAGLVIGLKTSRRIWKMKSMADQMATGGGSVSEEDLVSYILGGLGPEYEMLILRVIILKGVFDAGLYKLDLSVELKAGADNRIFDPLFQNKATAVSPQKSSCNQQLAEVNLQVPSQLEMCNSQTDSWNHFTFNNVAETDASSSRDTLVDETCNALVVHNNKHVDDNFNVLHQRLGHPSVVVLQKSVDSL